MTKSDTFSCIPARLAAVFGPPAALQGACLALVLLLTGYVQATETSPNPKAPDLTELPLEALMEIQVPKVYAASKYEQKTTEAPSLVTIVSAEEIKRYGYRTLADVLESVPDLYVSYDRNYTFLGVRGMNLGDLNNRVLVLVDGHRINNSVTDGTDIGTGFILDIDLADRVEVIRGPGSALYGNNAFFGVINVVTRKGGQVNGLEASFDYGSFDSYKGRVTYGKAFTNGLELLLSGSLYDSAGPDRLFYAEYDTPAQNNGLASDRDGDSYGSAFGSLAYADFTLEGAFIRRDKDNPTAQYYTTFNDSRLRTVDERSYEALKFAHSFPDVVDVTARVYCDQSSYEIGYPFSYLDDHGAVVVPSAFYQERDEGQWWGAELELNKELWDRHIVTAGAEYKDNYLLTQSIINGDTGKAVPGGSTNMTQQSYGIYVQSDFQVLTNLHLNGGVRYDKVSGYDPRLDPRVALIYQPFEQSTFKAIYGTAFRAPDFWELSYSGFQNLQPETITGYELVYEQGIGRNLRSSISGYYNQMDKLIFFENGSFTNLNADAKGIELALAGTWANGLLGQVSYTLQETENRTGSLALPDSPEQMVKLNLSAPLIKEKLFAGLEFLYTSSRNSLHNTTAANGEPLTVPGAVASGFPIVNLTLYSRNLVKNLEFSASVYNLLDQQYSDPATRFHVQDLIAQDGRSFRLKLTYRF